jgi:hypothetical protein
MKLEIKVNDRTIENPETGKSCHLRRALTLVKENRRPYLVLNLTYYGSVVLAMCYVANHPELQQKLLAAVGDAFGKGPLAVVGGAYSGGKVVAAILLTFVVNLLLGSVLVITAPSLVVPFSGLLVGMIRAILWGLILCPANPKLGGAMIPHSLTLLLEGQGYILAMLAVWIHGRAMFWPKSVAANSHLGGYLEGLKRTGQLYLLVTSMLAVAAVYEGLEVIYLAPLFR